MENLEANRRKSFGSLRNRNFRLLWTGGMLSHIGDDMQMVAVSWLVLMLTNSPVLMGVANLFQGLPRLVFGLIGGVVADRVNRYRFLILFQAGEMILSFFFAFLVLSGKIEYWHILVLLPVFGFIKMIYRVCRQAYLFDLVGREDLMNALALHSTGMNLSKIIGPSVAGIIIGIWGVGWCLLINGISFIAILVSFFMMRPPASAGRETRSTPVLKDLRETFVCLDQNRTILLLIGISFSHMMFGLHSHVIIPLFAQNVLHVGASGYGFLMAATGMGAVVGGVMMAGLGQIKRQGIYLLLAYLSYGFLLFLFSFSPYFILSLILIFLVGMAQMFTRTINQTLVQILSPDELRGRILGVFMLDHGMRPLGGLLIGFGASLLGAPLAMGFGAGVCIFIALSLLSKSSRLKEI